MSLAEHTRILAATGKLGFPGDGGAAPSHRWLLLIPPNVLSAISNLTEMEEEIQKDVVQSMFALMDLDRRHDNPGLIGELQFSEEQFAEAFSAIMLACTMELLRRVGMAEHADELSIFSDDKVYRKGESFEQSAAEAAIRVLIEREGAEGSP